MGMNDAVAVALVIAFFLLTAGLVRLAEKV